MHSYSSLKGNFNTARKQGLYGSRFIHAALQFLSRKRGVRMQQLECRLWIVGMLKDPTLREDFERFCDEYFRDPPAGELEASIFHQDEALVQSLRRELVLLSSDVDVGGGR